MALLLLATLFLAFIILYIFNFYNDVKKLPPSPFPLPIIGNINQFDPKSLHKWILKQREIYGSVFTVYIANPVVILSDVKSIKEATLPQNNEFFAERKLQFPDTFFQEIENTGVIMSTGDMWQVQRRLTLQIMRDFGMGKLLMENKIIESRNDLIDHLSTLEDKENVDFAHIIHLAVGNIINSIIFGFMYSYDDAKDFYDFTKIVDQVICFSVRWEFRVLSMFPKLADIQFVKDHVFPSFFGLNKELRQINRERIRKVRESFKQDEEPQNLVNALFKEINAEDSKYSCLNETHVNAIAFDMYLAGQETIAGHLCTRDTTICGKLIPKGTLVQLFFYGSNYDESVFEKPYEFKPERFLLEDGKTINKTLHEQNYSFGKGARVCAGKSLALAELQLIFPTLVQKFKFSHLHGEVNMFSDFGGILAPRKFTCKIVKRI